MDIQNLKKAWHNLADLYQDDAAEADRRAAYEAAHNATCEYLAQDAIEPRDADGFKAAVEQMIERLIGLVKPIVETIANTYSPEVRDCVLKLRRGQAAAMFQALAQAGMNARLIPAHDATFAELINAMLNGDGDAIDRWFASQRAFTGASPALDAHDRCVGGGKTGNEIQYGTPDDLERRNAEWQGEIDAMISRNSKLSYNAAVEMLAKRIEMSTKQIKRCTKNPKK